jgi:hypothetical protein
MAKRSQRRNSDIWLHIITHRIQVETTDGRPQRKPRLEQDFVALSASPLLVSALTGPF